MVHWDLRFPKRCSIVGGHAVRMMICWGVQGGPSFFHMLSWEGRLLSAQTNMRSFIATGNSHCAMVFAPAKKVERV